jgi:predicted DNA-binding ribbon-helix-helix protein
MSLTIPRSILIAGRKTSVRLENAFWVGLQEIADQRLMTLPGLIATIDAQRHHGNRSSALRLFVLEYYRRQVADAPEASSGISDPTVFAFRRYEDASLRYTGIERHEGLTHYGLVAAREGR